MACAKVGNFLPWPLHVGSSNWHISEENYCTDETAPVVFVRFKEIFCVKARRKFRKFRIFLNIFIMQ